VDENLSQVHVLIPARNEADGIARTLRGLAVQGANLRVTVVDDQSSDATAAIAADAAGTLDLDVVRGEPLPPGWGGKLWALEQGLRQVERPYTLLLDADIELAPGLISALREQMHSSGARLVSVMALLRCLSFWERLLVPPFVYFFKLIYPFASANNPRSRVAAAAGGCIFVETAVLRDVAAFGALRDALIDDCTLAALVKRSGYAIWLGLSHSVSSQRQYANLGSFSQMVSRTAFTQLRYSTVLLMLVTLLMLLLFVLPIVGLVAVPSVLGIWIASLTLAAMAVSYLPTVRFYGLPAIWTLTLPIAAALFLVMTWQSAIAYWRGRRAEWKERVYATAGGRHVKR
jgi:hopene-associated glycosyltransferase HpnB